MRPVDADAIENKALENRQKGEIEDWEFDSIINYLDGAPTINAATNMYCKDCKHSYTKNRPCDTALFRWCRKWDNIVRDCDFCSYGELKTNGGTGNAVD